MQLPDLEKLDIFYDDGIRGVWNAQITPDLVYKISQILWNQIPGDKFLLASDMRTCSETMFKIFVAAADLKGKEITYLGKTSFDIFQYGFFEGKYDGGIYLSPGNGDRRLAGIRLFTEDCYEIDYQIIKQSLSTDVGVIPEDLLSKELKYLENNYQKDYFFHCLKFVDPLAWEKFKIVIDGGNGMGGDLLRKMLGKVPQVESVFINFEPNEFFPHHFPNPLAANNNQELIQRIKEERADLGVTLNQDGSSLVLIDENGVSSSPAHVAALLARIVLERNPKAKIGYDYFQNKSLTKVIADMQAIPVPVSSGYRNIRKLMQELDLQFCAESDAKYYFKDSYSGNNAFLCLCLILEYLAKNRCTLSQALTQIREQNSASAQLNFILAEGSNWNNIKFSLTDLFQEAHPQEPDGLVLEGDNYRISARIFHKVYLQVYIEAGTELYVNELQNKLISKIQDLGLFIGSQGEELDLKIFQTDNRQKFELLLNNMWFTWNPHYILPIIDMYGDGWRKNMPPEAIIANYGKEKLKDILNEKSWELDQNLRLFNDYFNRNPVYPKFDHGPIAYFCMEFGLVDWLQTYSGGLGILAGDFIKQTSDMAIPTVGVGIFYHQGYLHQDFAPDGRQIEDYIHQEPMDFNMELVKEDGKTLTIELLLDNHIVKVRAWKQKVGLNDLYLLDTNFEENEEWEDRLITGYLYGGDLENRIRQELVLGIAGARLLERLHIKPVIYHMNEGHSGFLVIDCIRQIMQEKQNDFDSAIKEVSQKLVFTNHTLKTAGNDIFDFMLFEKYLKPYAQELNITVDKLFSLGDDKTYSQGGFSMTIFGLRHAKVSNAVSKLHAKAAENIWNEYPLTAVTNGVHMPTWVSPEIHQLLDEYLGENWHYAWQKIDFDRIQKIPHNKIWLMHQQRKNKLIHSLNTELGLNLRNDVLTIAWSRRLAQYKRPDLLITDLERLKEIVSSVNRPVQILIAGKSHPKDLIGKQILQKMNHCFETEDFNNKVEIIPGYNWQLARRMVSGADIWLNTPYRFEEACGTSGMKAAANGLIQFTTLDGWTDEVDWYRIGWVIAEDNPAESLYSTLEKNIIPLFYDQGPGGYNDDWVTMMLNSMQMSLKDFSAERMIRDYLDKVYSQII